MALPNLAQPRQTVSHSHGLFFPLVEESAGGARGMDNRIDYTVEKARGCLAGCCQIFRHPNRDIRGLVWPGLKG